MPRVTSLAKVFKEAFGRQLRNSPQGELLQVRQHVAVVQRAHEVLLDVGGRLEANASLQCMLNSPTYAAWTRGSLTMSHTQ